MWTLTFWKRTAERSIKTVAQTAIATMGTTVVAITSLDWGQIAAISATGGVLSVLTSIASSGVGDPDSPSLVKTED